MYSTRVRPLRFIGPSLDDLRNFPDEARRAAGFELRVLQNGFEPSDWRAIPAVGHGVREIRIHVLGEWRVVYVATLGGAVFAASPREERIISPADAETEGRRSPVTR